MKNELLLDVLTESNTHLTIHSSTTFNTRMKRLRQQYTRFWLSRTKFDGPHPQTEEPTMATKEEYNNAVQKGTQLLALLSSSATGTNAFPGMGHSVSSAAESLFKDTTALADNGYFDSKDDLGGYTSCLTVLGPALEALRLNNLFAKDGGKNTRVSHLLPSKPVGAYTARVVYVKFPTRAN